METARFLVSLTRSENRLCRVERNVRRKDKSRAVLYAQIWLIKTQPLERYFGVTYNVYEIYEQDDSGQWVRVEIGGVLDAETGRAKVRETQQQAKKASIPAQRSRMESNSKGSAPKRKGRASTRTDTVFGYEVQERRRKTRTPLQQRIDQAKENARQAIAEKKARGET